MDVFLITQRISLQPDVVGEVLVDVVNTEDIIDALHVELAGIPGAKVHLDAAPTLFPGERRRLPLRVQLPAQVPAGRHELEVRIEATAGQQHRQVTLIVDVWPKPALAVGVQPSVRHATRKAGFPLTVANRGNTPLLARPREVDIPDQVAVTFDPVEFTVRPWETYVCTAHVIGPSHLIGTDHEHPLDLRVCAWSVTPGHPLLEEEISEDVRVTFRQRAVLPAGTVFTVGLILVLVLWGGLAYIGLRAFVSAKAPSLAAADDFFPASAVPGEVGAAITVSGQVVSSVDDHPMAGVTVLACSQDVEVRTACTPLTATGSTVSDGTGWFRLLGTFPGPYQLQFLPTESPVVSLPDNWFESSCRIYQRMPSRAGTLRLSVAQPPGTDRDAKVAVVARVATAPAATSATPAAPAPGGTAGGTAGGAQSGGAASGGTQSGSPAGAIQLLADNLPSCRRAVVPGARSTSTPGPRSTSTPSPRSTTTPSPDASATVTASSQALLSGPEQTRHPGRRKRWHVDVTSVSSVDGTLTAMVNLKGLPAPGRYDLTITAGTSATLTMRSVPVEAGTQPGRLQVTLLATSSDPASSGAPSGTVSPSPAAVVSP